MTRPCSICGAVAEWHHHATLLSRHQVSYYWCRACGLLSTEEPYWLAEAYDSAIAESDTGLVRRSIGLALATAPLLHHMFGRSGRYVDVGGGYGVYTRVMRDIGFDFFWSDPYCANLFARGWEADNSQDAHFVAATAFEVVEHLHDPLRWMSECLERYQLRTLIFSTQLYSGEPPQPGTWSYYSELTGQHLSFYTRDTLHRLAQKLGLRVYSHGHLHMLTDQPLRTGTFRALTGRWAGALLPWIVSRLGSRTVRDRDRVLATVAARRLPS